MSGIAIYMEGGGDSSQRIRLRQGMDRFLAEMKDRTRARRWKWKVVACGSRRDACGAFENGLANQKPDEIIILLVDSESQVTATTRVGHLCQGVGDGWHIEASREDQIHFMAQTTETWLVADPDALAAYYGQGFRRGALPSRHDLEEEPKADCAVKLCSATRGTGKGEYNKGQHTADLLGLISATKVRMRCRHAEILFSTLGRLLA